MMQSHVLHVSTGGDAVGRVTFESLENRYGFQYARAWAENRRAYYLAPAIPLTGEAVGALSFFSIGRFT
jgi:serine/threonine-protein kinase HipA